MRCIALTGEGGGRAHCVPGTTFMIECNKCMCGQSGRRAYCTKKNCLKLLDDACVPGRVTQVECNTCICSAQGRWSCTKKLCHGFKYEECEPGTIQKGLGDMAANQTCIPGTSFRIRCQRCYCSHDGVSAVCRRPPCNGIKDNAKNK
ncbi:pacifastin-like protease inhibitor cvp4 [Schistocerca cancellata]|uniref:pacifastin-like protease inhibitor cvp4 n=1 Tax=Schistocerca cancellata TaxID=274614 RepID=UPI00211804CA|nr:pacifastin-like protease inhibitor cvp4 [Schistocerca cancellata]